MEHFTKQLQQMAKHVYELDKVYEMEAMQLRFETLLIDKPLWTLRVEQPHGSDKMSTLLTFEQILQIEGWLDTPTSSKVEKAKRLRKWNKQNKRSKFLLHRKGNEIKKEKRLRPSW